MLVSEASQALQANAKASAEERQRLEADAQNAEASLQSQGRTLIINEQQALSAAHAAMALQTQEMRDLQQVVYESRLQAEQSAETLRQVQCSEAAAVEAAQRMSLPASSADRAPSNIGSASAQMVTPPLYFTTNGFDF
jgi:hypothetical protein